MVGTADDTSSADVDAIACRRVLDEVSLNGWKAGFRKIECSLAAHDVGSGMGGRSMTIFEFVFSLYNPLFGLALAQVFAGFGDT